MDLFLPPNVRIKVFDKSFQKSTHLYGMYRFEDENKRQEIRQNFQAITSELKAQHLLILKQEHSNIICDADSLADAMCFPEADGVVTTRKNFALAIQSADCVPVLLASHNPSVIGAVHCGWRGTKNDILFYMIKAMQDKGASNITAFIGPAIQQNSYEIDSTFYQVIINTEPHGSFLFKPSLKNSHYFFDLPGFVIMKLKNLGIMNVINCAEDTYGNPEKYFSYRRDTHLNIKGKKTNILSTIVIE
jgi:hypothetical protein